MFGINKILWIIGAAGIAVWVLQRRKVEKMPNANEGNDIPGKGLLDQAYDWVFGGDVGF